MVKLIRLILILFAKKYIKFFTDEESYLYWCDFKDTFNTNHNERDKTELISRKWSKLDKALKMLRKNEITDALTHISIFFFELC